MTDDNIAFIGLGNMGRPMVSNLAKAGFIVHAFDSNSDAVSSIERQNTIVASSVSDAVMHSSIVFTMLPNGAIVNDVLQQIITAAQSSLLIVDFSTIDIDDAKQAHALAAESGHVFFDAPVSGGVAGAAAGSLTAMIGGDQSKVDRLTPFLNSMFDRQIYCGDAGAGQAAKICNNMLLATTMIGVCESFNLASSLGLSADTLFEVLSTSTGSCWSVNHYCPVQGVGPESPADRSFAPGFSSSMMLKDMKLTQSAAETTQVATPLGQRSLELFQHFVDEQNGEKDFSGIIRFLEQMQR
ncbi:MAG: 3-hydroxyisobutyrate dehydrogenase [Granulosicoccus sp.]